MVTDAGGHQGTVRLEMHVVFLHAHGVGSVHTACLVLLDPSCQIDDVNARHVHISVQLLASLLHFIIASVSALMVSAVQIQMMDCLNPAKIYGSVLV